MVLLVGLIVVLGVQHWQRAKMSEVIQRQIAVNQSIKEQWHQSMLKSLGGAPMMRTLTAIDGAEQGYLYRGSLLAGLRDMAILSNLELQGITETDDPAGHEDVLQLELRGRLSQLVAYLGYLSAHIKSLEDFGLLVSREDGQPHQYMMTVTMPQAIIHPMRYSEIMVSQGTDQLGVLHIDGRQWMVLRALDGSLHLQEAGRL